MTDGRGDARAPILRRQSLADCAGAHRARTLVRCRGGVAFWVDELGSNCCRKSDLADDALAALFGAEPQSAEEDVETAAARLRRRLLPLQGRLRWSMLANGLVVAGR